MSWVQQPTAAAALNSQQTASITQAQYQHQQQYTHGSATSTPTAFSSKTALTQTALPPPSAKQMPFQNHVQHAPAAHYNTLTNVPPLSSQSLQQHFKSSPLQQQQQQPIQQQQTQNWQQQQTYQQNNNRAMQTQPPTLNSWPQQQLQPQQQNAQQQLNLQQQQQGGYQQNANSWQQPELQAAAQSPLHQQQQQQPPPPQQQQQQPNMYENYFTQDQSLQQNQQHQQKQQPYFQQNDLNAFNQQQTTQPFNFNEYDNSNNSINANTTVSNNVNNNNNKTSDGWGDWGDWNDNHSATSNELQHQNAHAHEQQQQQTLHNANVIEDSFNIQNNSKNDGWQWNISENATATTVPTNIQPIPVEKPTAMATTQVPTQQQSTQQQASQQNLPGAPPTQQALQQQQSNQQQSQPQHSVDFSVVSSKAATVVSTIKPPNTLALSTTTTAENSFNSLNVGAANPNSANFPNNIPNSVYVSQAKPVTRPSRQFASPPTGNTPLEAPESSVLLPSPPQAFQNDELTKSTMPPPPIPIGNSSGPAANSNPFKRAGVVKHHRAEILSSTATTSPMIATSFDMPPPPPADFANPSSLNLEPDNSEVLHENQEVIAPPAPILQNISLSGSALPNAERNQYMQTSHLSENQDDEYNLEADSLPPPGLSRLVLGEPELEATQRLVTGTEEPSISSTGASHMDMEERHADGEDTSVEQMPNVVTSATNVGISRVVASDISTDRNLYQVPGESNLSNERRIVPGVETDESITLSIAPSATQVRSDQREIELDGENLEDQHQPLSINAVTSRNEPPLEGAAANGAAVLPASTTEHAHSHQIKTVASKTQSNASTGNDSELEQSEQHHNQRFKNTRSVGKNSDNDRRIEKQRRDKQRSIERSFGSEEASEEYSSDRERERRRGYREGSARSDRGKDERRDGREQQRRRDKRDDLSAADRDRMRDKYYGERRKDAAGASKAVPNQRGTRYNRYDADETEESQPSRHDASTTNVSSRKDYARRSMRVHGSTRDAHDDRSDRDYDDRYDRTHRRSKREKDLDRSERRDDERERRERRGTRRVERGERDDYDTVERRRRAEKQHPRDYEEYRKQSSRNARDSDLEKDPRHVRNGNGGPITDTRFDPRLMYGYPTTAPYGMDYYYYEHLARTNPKAYNEYYKKYYEQQAMAAMSNSQQSASSATALGESISANATVGGDSSSLVATDGRESVHSGRSSAHNEKDRYTQAYMSQANQYHRHYQQKAQYHHSQQQQQLQQQQHLQQQQKRMSAASYQNFPMNSTFHGDTSSVASFGSYSRIGRLSAAQSVDNISNASSQIPSLPTSATFRAMTGYYMGTGSVSYTNLDCYADSRSGQISLRDGENSTIEQQRSTPFKFSSLHAVVSLSTGILVTVKPKLTSKGHLNNIVKLQRIGINDGARHLYQAFPGPLVRGLTHKKTIIDFCEEQIRLGPMETTIYARQLTPRSVEKYRASYTLMWNLLILLLRQNGMVVGTDIAELLLKNEQQFPYHNSIDTESSRRMHSISDDDASITSVDGSAVAADQKANDEQKAVDAVTNENENENDGNKIELLDAVNGLTKPQTQLSETEITEKFRNYLLYGNVNEALDWATDNNLWGHALFLASKVDRRSHANVMMKFANKLALNDPLQTLYQLMSGRTPSSVTSVQDEKWGDWRPHLSMILSNTSQKPELDRKAITTLGDSLFNRGDLYAAHFCYLMAQVGFGRYQESAVQETTIQQNLPKLVLLGSSHYKNFRDFATNESIMMTEIYEYACSLNDEKFSLIEFQPYKYLLAIRMLDYGYNLKSLMYMEQISLHIARDPSRYEPSFIDKVYEIADRLKYFDPVLEKTLDDQLQNNDENSNADMQNTLPQNFEEQKWLQSLRNIAMQHKLDSAAPTNIQNQINQEFAEINKQFSELNLQYTTIIQQDPNLYNAEMMTQQQQQPQQQQQQQVSQDITEQQQQQFQSDYAQYATTAVSPQTAYNDYGNVAALQPVATTAAVDPTNPADAYANYAQEQQQQAQQPSAYYDPNTQQAYDAYAQQNVAAYSGDYWAQQQQHVAEENARPTISMPRSKTYDSDDEKQKMQNASTANQAKNSGQQNKNDAKDLGKNMQQGNQNSGWFGGIWNKLSLKPKNQMILPDDKNPTIVWDAEKKRWVNTDGEEATEENLRPPPKMSDILPQQAIQQIPQQMQQPLQQQPQPLMQQQPQLQQMPLTDNNNLQPMTVPLASSSPLSNYSASAAAQGAPTTANVAAAKPPSLQSNMFKMQRNRTLKNSYVDVFNPSGAPMSKATENVLAPALPAPTVPQGGFFIPDSSPASGVANNEATPAYQQQQQETPQFYNPNQFSSSGY